MNTMSQEALASIVRWVMAIGAGYLVRAGIWTEGDATGYVTAGALAVVGLGWSLWQKRTKEAEVVAALNTTKGTSIEAFRSSYGA